MLGHDYFYNSNLKKIVALFGSIFNDLYIAKQTVGGQLSSVQRVPLSYAPREKYLARINLDERSAVSIKLPRMSFEITAITPDSVSRLNKFNRTLQTDADGNIVRVGQSAPYNISIALNVMSRSQDEALQIVEQILPWFNPTYSLRAKGLEGPESLTDIPITLQDVSFEDSYEGDFESSRRTIIYTLTFELKTKFSSPPSTAKVIQEVDLNFFSTLDFLDDPVSSIKIEQETPESEIIVTKTENPAIRL
jgi:hypothetical protein